MSRSESELLETMQDCDSHDVPEPLATVPWFHADHVKLANDPVRRLFGPRTCSGARDSARVNHEEQIGWLKQTVSSDVSGYFGHVAKRTVGKQPLHCVRPDPVAHAARVVQDRAPVLRIAWLEGPQRVAIGNFQRWKIVQGATMHEQLREPLGCTVKQ
jgi:hypothetical protein